MKAAAAVELRLLWQSAAVSRPRLRSIASMLPQLRLRRSIGAIALCGTVFVSIA